MASSSRARTAHSVVERWNGKGNFIGSKQRLFVEVFTTPFEPAVAIPEVFAGDRAKIGERVARFLLTVLEDPDGRRRITGLIRAAASEPRRPARSAP